MPTDYERQPSVATTTIITIVGIEHRMDRRRLLVAGSTAVTAGLAGCSGLLGGGSEDEEPAQPQITRIGIGSEGGQGQVSGQISNPTDESVDRSVYARIYEQPQEVSALLEQSPEETLSQTYNGIPPGGAGGGFVLSIPEIYTISSLSDNIEAALMPAGEEPSGSDYRWYGPDAGTLNGDGQ